MISLQIVGGGRMGEALAGGLVAAGWSPDDIGVVEPVAARREALAAALPGIAVHDVAMPCRGAVLAVKPDDVEVACHALVAAGVGRVLSIAAGVPLTRLQAALGEAVPVVRAMPNTPAVIGAGAAAIAGARVDEDDLAWAESVLAAVGTVVRVPERLLDAVTGLSGSGPAYVFLVAEAMAEGGVLAGLPRPTAESLAAQTLLGAARLLVESEEGPEALRAAVTSPAGTTAAGLRELERHGVRAAFIEAVAAATARSRELGGG